MSLFERCHDILEQNKSSSVVHKLTDEFRMNHSIMEFPNKQFFGNELVPYRYPIQTSHSNKFMLFSQFFSFFSESLQLELVPVGSYRIFNVESKVSEAGVQASEK